MKNLGIWCNQVATCPTCYRGTCQVTNGVAKCVCEAGWYLSDCRRHNCNGNGHSEIVNGQAVCNCKNGWFGDLCQTEVTQAIGGITHHCINGKMYNGQCYCHANWQGQWCDQPMPQRTCSRNCGNGTCRMGTNTDGDYCVCNPGFSGSNCQTTVCTGRCPGQLCRIINNRADCYDLRPTNCYQKSCSNNQHCIMVGSTPTCQCNSGYSGFPSCTTPISCSTKPCGVNMHCRMNGVTPVCVCNAGYYPSGSTCIKFNPPSCSTKSCPTNQHCRMVGSSSTCHCNTGYSGSSCTIPTSCSTKVCVGNKNCIMSSGMPTCVCKNGWTGDHCNVHVCNKQCINGSCQWLNGSQRCICNSGYIGENCAQREPQPCTKACAHGGICKFNLNGQQYCDCPDGWTSDDCTVTNICDKNCGSHGTCIGSGSTSRCECYDNYTGDHCNIKPCPDNCNGRGSCNMGTCVCNNGKPT